MMRLDQLRLFFEAGDLLSAEIVTAPLEPGPEARWMLECRRRNGSHMALALNRRKAGREQVRIFNSLDAAFAAAKAIGFQAATIRS
ncbi:MAG: hypothetical protein WD623_01215 [Marinobacter sp.]|uniref:hypothetical protein n=1 Tax=Marinobacter sp. TaxID=50741 RepID=UPI0034A00EE9